MKYFLMLILVCSLAYAEEPEVIVPAQEILDALPPIPQFDALYERESWAKEQSKVYEGRKVFLKAKIAYIRGNIAGIVDFDYLHVRKYTKDWQVFVVYIPEHLKATLEKGDFIEITGTIERCRIENFRKSEKEELKQEWVILLKSDWFISKVIKGEKKK